jgi:hypothetical protein
MENNSDLEFLLMFTNFPYIDRNSFTTKDYICNKYNWDVVVEKTLKLYQR